MFTQDLKSILSPSMDPCKKQFTDLDLTIDSSNILSSVLQLSDDKNTQMWQQLNESNAPNFVDNLLSNSGGRAIFELLMVTHGYFDARLFTADSSMLLLVQICDPKISYHHSDEASLELLDRLKLIQSEQTCAEKLSETKLLEKLNILPTHYSKYSDILIRIFGNHCLRIVLQNTGSFLIQHLFLTCSVDYKMYFTELMLSAFEKLVPHRSGNYMLKLVLEWLCNLKPSGKCTMNHKYKINYCEESQKVQLFKLKCWAMVTQWVFDNPHKFYMFSCNRYGSFAMKLIVKSLDFWHHQALIKILAQRKYIKHFYHNRNGKFVIQALKQSLNKKYIQKIEFPPVEFISQLMAEY